MLNENLEKKRISFERRWGNLGNNFLTKIDWLDVQEKYNRGYSTNEILKELKIARYALDKAVRLGLVIRKHKPRNHSEETKRMLSEKRKKFLKENPDKHPWRNNDKFKSKPCEKAKEFLRELNILFIEEYQPEIEGRSFSLDIAMPDKMIALEINGNQHYERDGSLKPYYQDRHDLLVSLGWTVFEIHYSSCFNLNEWAEFAETLKNGAAVKDFDYFLYKPREKKCRWKNQCVCGNNKSSKANSCSSCRSRSIKNLIQPSKKRRERMTKKDECNCGREKCVVASICLFCHVNSDHEVISWPTKEELFSLVWSKPLRDIAKDLFVSDVAVKKRCRKLQIPTPPHGHWQKKKEDRIERPSF